MAETPSTMLPLGTAMPEFSLPNTVTGETYTWADLKDKRAALIMFICNHCPFVKHIIGELGRIAADYMAKGIGIVAINSNDAAKYADDDPEHMKALARDEGWEFPFLFDESQEVAKLFQAACTPDFFVFDTAGKLAYRGQLDDSRPGNNAPVTGTDLREALDAVLAGAPPPSQQKPSIGCNIKWKPGNEPDYFG
jgi:peroxiredoxin